MQKNRTKSRRRNAAFTLMEVLLVLAILVILGGMVTLMYQNVQSNAYKRSARVQIGLFQEAVKLYQLEVGSYPQTLQDLITNNSGQDDSVGSWPYIKEVPNDPWGQAYEFKAGDPPVISSPGPDRQSNTQDDISG